MVKYWIEVGALVVAAFAMVISAVQTRVLIDTVDAPYKSNLQDRQIEACAGLIEAYSAYSGGSELTAIAAAKWKAATFSAYTWKKEAPPLLVDPSDEDGDLRQMDVDDISDAVESMNNNLRDWTAYSAFAPDYRGEVLAQIGKMRVYSGDDMNAKLDELREALSEDRMVEFERSLELRRQLESGNFDPSAAFADAPEKASTAAYESVESRCRSVMLGESVGFL